MRRVAILGLLSATAAPAQSAWDTPFTISSIIEPDALQDAADYRGTAIYDVARITAQVEDDGGAAFCTGFRVGATSFMTNQHCSLVVPCAGVRFRMGYETGVPAEQQALFRCTELLASSEELDFALYRVDAATPD